MNVNVVPAYDQEYLFFLSEMDSLIHDLVEQRGVEAVDRSGRLANYFPNYWFLNGRNAPDTMAEAYVGRLPTQPYNCLPRTHPGGALTSREYFIERIEHMAGRSPHRAAFPSVSFDARRRFASSICVLVQAPAAAGRPPSGVSP